MQTLLKAVIILGAMHALMDWDVMADEEAGLIAQSLSDARVEILALCAEIRGALSSLCNDMDSGFTRLGERIDALASEVRHAKQELIRRLENA